MFGINDIYVFTILKTWNFYTWFWGRYNFANELIQIHNTFHVSQLWKCVVDDSMVFPFDDIQFDDRRNYVERPVAILDRNTKVMRNKMVSLVKVQLQNHKGSKWTWEHEAEIREHYPELFVDKDFKNEL